MKRFLLAFGLLASFASYATDTIIYHENCFFKNNTMTITDANGEYAKNSPESIMGELGYASATSIDPNDAMEDLMQLNYSDLTIDREVTVELIVGSKAFLSSGRDIAEAVAGLPECRRY